MFWGNEILADRLPELISDYSPARLDQGAYRLRIGHEVYVSPTGEKGDRKNKPKTSLAPGQAFTIPSGQFAFLLTEETIKVPVDAVAFISVRATYKFRGLANISGFHVDPNYAGKLIFAVFNAGPSPVHLQRGEECFQIWFAKAEGNTNLPPKIGHEDIPSKLISSLGGELLHSLSGLNTKITHIQNEQNIIRTTAGIVIAILVGLLAFGLRGLLWPTSETANAPTPQIEGAAENSEQAPETRLPATKQE